MSERANEVGRHFLSGFDGPSVTPEVRELILKEKVLGFTLFKWNIQSADQLSELTDELRSLACQAGYDIILGVDQEGGRVQRLPAPYTRIPAMRQWAEACQKSCDPSHLFELGRILGREVRLAGFNLDYAPVVDVDSNPANPIIGDRSFSRDPEIVYQYAKEVIRGLMRESVIPCIKHFPGHGDTNQDSHLELPVDSRPADVILNSDMLPYSKLIAEGLAPTIMTAHVVYPSLDPDNPATLSSKIVSGILRGDLAYDGVIFSDDFIMQAIADNFDLTEAAKKFFLNGGDVVLVCKKPELSLEIIGKIKSELKRDTVLAERLAQAASRIETLKRQFLSNFSEPLSRDAVVRGHQEYLKKIFTA